MNKVLVLYYSSTGATKNLAQIIARGVESVEGVEAVIRTVPRISARSEQVDPEIPKEGAIFASLEDLADCDGLILGSPGRFGNMAAPMKYFWEQTTPLWLENRLVGKPAGVFTSTASLHGGQETTLMNMMTVLFHHGMMVVGVPYSCEELRKTKTGGTPYGASHVSGGGGLPIDDHEKAIAFFLGSRIAKISLANLGFSD